MAAIHDPWDDSVTESGECESLAGLSDHPQLLALWRLWEQRRGSKAMPGRRDVSPEILWPWLGNVSLINVNQSPLRLQYRLVGTNVVDLSRHDFTGRHLDELFDNPTQNPLTRGYYRCLMRRRPVFEVVRQHSRDKVSYDSWRLDLPLSTDGRVVDMIMTGEYLRAMPAATEISDLLASTSYSSASIN